LVDESDNGSGDFLAKVVVDDLFEDRDPRILKRRSTVVVDIESVLREEKRVRERQRVVMRDQVCEELLEPLVHDLVVLPAPVEFSQEVHIRTIF
jgi:hypothetical protein